jgi:uncharacterized membrane protein
MQINFYTGIEKNKKTLDSHQRILIAFVLAVLSFFVLCTYFNSEISFIGAWNVFALTDILLAWAVILKKNAKNIVMSARLQDASRSAIMIFVVISALMSLIAIFLLLKSAKYSQTHSADNILLLAFITVAFSWILIHTVFTIHYSHIYYSDDNGKHKGGLIFPNDTNPAFTDFAYYSFVVGMTFQVSDVQVTSKRMRKLTLIHGLISFIFNTFILALSINIIAGLL